MSIREININESVKKGKLVIIESFYYKASNITLLYLFLTSIILISVLAFFEQLGSFIDTLVASLILAVGGIIAYSIFIGIIERRKLFRIKGGTIEKNKGLISELSRENQWRISEDSENLMILIPKKKFFSSPSGREIIIIHDKEDMLINVTSFGWGHLESPIYGRASKQIINIIKSKFEGYGT